MAINNKTTINIFYGPRDEFEKKIKKKKNKETLFSIVLEYDEERRKIPINLKGNTANDYNKDKTKRKIQNLIINSDEYAGITESAMQNFISILSYYDIQNIEIQNPPITIMEQLKKAFKKVSEVENVYKNFSALDIKRIEEEFSKQIIGQEQAKRGILRNIISSIKMNNDNKPMVLMFYGPSGVGKTETAKLLSKVLGEDLFREQFSMFQNNEFSSYLYGGNHFQDSFAKRLYDRKSNIIFLDEFDKANKYFFSAFYQLFDEGIFIDKNYRIELQNAIIICTSNYLTTEEIKDKLGEPIFYRFDSFIEFKDLSSESLKKIIDRQYNKCLKQLSQEEAKYIENIEIKGKNIAEHLNEILISNHVNARKINTFIKEYISDFLLNKYL